ncbi:MAG TPA: hypothetical protein VHV78_05535, partial [Gemmatimonadaceae bacterium]|nr:hypothetical protein [Gemmatimonadaceae bacterium]
ITRNAPAPDARTTQPVPPPRPGEALPPAQDRSRMAPSQSPTFNRPPAQREGGAVAPPMRSTRPIITRNAPPPQVPTVDARQRAMEAHPGRPLEPTQMDDIRAGRPVSTPRDVEVPAHPAPQARPAPPPRPAPQRQEAPPPAKRKPGH